MLLSGFFPHCYHYHSLAGQFTLIRVAPLPSPTPMYKEVGQAKVTSMLTRYLQTPTGVFLQALPVLTRAITRLC